MTVKNFKPVVTQILSLARSDLHVRPTIIKDTEEEHVVRIYVVCPKIKNDALYDASSGSKQQ